MKSRTSAVSFAVFDSPIGPCAIAWSGRGVVRFLLPEATAAESEERLRAFVPGASAAKPRGWVAALIERVRKHLEGHHDDFADVPLDTDGLPPFHAAVYDALRKVPAGATTTYGALGRKTSGTTGAARAVGIAMARNPFPIFVPCHRVLDSSGKLHGFSAHGGLATKARLLAIEGRSSPEQTTLFADAPEAVQPTVTRSYVKELQRAKSAKAPRSEKRSKAARSPTS
jgi:methylated-DNA-[protein]-cysteine S-methyltransferase